MLLLLKFLKKRKKFSLFKKNKDKNNDTNQLSGIDSPASVAQPFLESQSDVLDLSYDDKNITSSTSLQGNQNTSDLFNVSVGEIANIGNNTESSNVIMKVIIMKLRF